MRFNYFPHAFWETESITNLPDASNNWNVTDMYASCHSDGFDGFFAYSSHSWNHSSRLTWKIQKQRYYPFWYVPNLFFVRCSSTFFIGKICIKNDTFIRTVKILSFTWPSWSVSAPCLKLSHILSKVSLILWALGLSADQPLFSLIRYEKKKLGILLSSRNVISFRFPHSIHRSFKNVKCLLV